LMEKYKFFEHVADIMFEAYGKDYPGALENAAKAMFSVFGKAEERESAEFAVTAHNLEELTVQLLADVLAHMDTHEIVFSRLEVTAFDRKRVHAEAKAFGERKRPRDVVKAVTYHELMVKEDKEGWIIRIILDV